MKTEHTELMNDIRQQSFASALSRSSGGLARPHDGGPSGPRLAAVRVSSSPPVAGLAQNHWLTFLNQSFPKRNVGNWHHPQSPFFLKGGDGPTNSKTRECLRSDLSDRVALATSASWRMRRPDGNCRSVARK